MSYNNILFEQIQCSQVLYNVMYLKINMNQL